MQKKQSSLSRILSYAGGHKNLTLLGCILSALSAVLGLLPYVCVWLAARNVLEAWPDPGGVSGLARWGLIAVWTAIGSIALYFAALMSTHIAAFRTARNIRRAAMAHVLKLPLGFFTGNQSGRLSLREISQDGSENSLTTTPGSRRICWLISSPIWRDPSSRLSLPSSCSSSLTGKWGFCACSPWRWPCCPCA